MRGAVSQILGLLLFASAASAQGVSPQAPPVKDWVQETVVVTARSPGPLLWRAHRGTGEVYILAIVGAMPEGLKWNHTHLEKILDGAKTLYLQPRAEVGLVEGAWFLLTDRSSLELPNDEHLEDVLPPSLKERFVRAREKFHRDAGRYEDFLPAFAGFRLFGDFFDDAKLEPREPARTVERLAGRKDVPSHPIATYEALPVIKDIAKMSPAQNLTCLKAALDDIDVEDAHQVAAAQAWATGDLDAMKANYSEATLFACLETVPSFATAWKQSAADTARAIDAALADGGKSVLLVSLGALLRKDGVLDHLRAEGVTVDDPD